MLFSNRIAMPHWTHRKTWPDYRANDRVVLRDGVRVARVYEMEHGPQTGEWLWFGWWAGVDNCGAAETLSEALEAVRGRLTGGPGEPA